MCSCGIRWQDGWVKKEVRPGGGERRTKGNGGAARSAAVGKPRRKPPWTSPSGSIALAALEKPAGETASDEPIGKHRLGGIGKSRGGSPPQTSPSATLEKPAKGRLRRAHREASPRRAHAASDGGRLGKERSTTGRRGREGQKGTAALRAAPPLENPAEGRLGRAHREASPRRPCKTPQKAASDEPIGKHRLGGPAKPRGKPPQTSPSASIASATLEKPAMFAPATRL